MREYSDRGNEFFYKIRMLDNNKTFAVDERTVKMYKDMSPEQFEDISIKILEYFLCDEIIVKLRKMLTIEQFRSKELAKLYREISFDSSLEFQSQLFAVLIKEGLIIEADPYVLALEFFAPVFLIFYKFDNDEKGFLQAKKLIAQHVQHFNQIYSTRKLRH